VADPLGFDFTRLPFFFSCRYLQDWKERACLKVDELHTLFGNIQEVYEFNSSLLEKLIESQADPQKISKCFIEAHERFDVYTTYW